MNRSSLSKLLVAGLAVVSLAGACGDDEEPVEAAAPTAEPTPTAAPVSAPDAGTEPATPEIPEVAQLTADDFTVLHECRYGFYASNADDTAGLLITFEDMTAAETGNVPPVGNVPSIIWSGELRLGTDLFAGWCDDTPSTAAVTDRYPVDNALLSIGGEPPIGGEAPLTAEVSGLVVTTDDGPVELGDLTIANSRWGYFPN